MGLKDKQIQLDSLPLKEFLVKNMAQLSTEDWEEKIRNPDPRVKWAMDVMDKEGNDFEGFVGRIWAPLSTAIFPVAANTVYNIQQRVPLRANLIPALVSTPFFGLIGFYSRKFFDNRRMEEEAIMRHYILTHPEKKRHKLGTLSQVRPH